MNKRFELWLDESGEFKDEAKLKDEGKQPSLVGGILFEKRKAEKIDLQQLIDGIHTHATEMSGNEKVTYVLPTLEALKEAGAIEVFFENAKYKDNASSRELYLSIMAEGLIQLVSRLDAEYESVDLDVYISQRQDPEETDLSKRRINESEYVEELQKRFKSKRLLNRVLLDSDTKVSFLIEPNANSVKLQCADFACNARLTRDSAAFKNVRDRVAAVQSNALIFTLSERPTINIVKRCLTKNNISEAIFELYTTLENVTTEDKKELEKLIVARMKHLSYRMMKSQLKQCSANIVAYNQSQDDYEIAVGMYREIEEGILEQMKAEKLPYENFQFTILLHLADAYLREGDIISARKVIEELLVVEKKIGDSLEELINFYLVLDKLGLLCIDEFDYKQARKHLSVSRQIFKEAEKTLLGQAFVGDRFLDFRSEYLGDTICMELYAMLFMQREQPELYEEMCALSDLGMKQYPDYPGELQRHLQYRSHIEMAHGDYEKALQYLYKAVDYREETIDATTMITFMDEVCDQEQTVGCLYFLMYYMLIMVEAKLAGYGLADEMFAAMNKQKRFKEYGVLPTINTGMTNVDISQVTLDESGIQYHPVEVIWWKYATYLMLEGMTETADTFYSKAIDLCYINERYVTMRITGLGIAAEKVYAQLKRGTKKGASEQIAEIIRRADALLQLELTEETKAFVQKIRALLQEAKAGQEVSEALLWQASRLIAY